MALAFRATGPGSGAIGRAANNGRIDRPAGLNCVVAAVSFDPMLGLVQLGTVHAGNLSTTFRRLSLLSRCAVLLETRPVGWSHPLLAALDDSAPSWTLSGHCVMLRRVGFSRLSAAWSCAPRERAAGGWHVR